MRRQATPAAEAKDKDDDEGRSSTYKDRPVSGKRQEVGRLALEGQARGLLLRGQQQVL